MNVAGALWRTNRGRTRSKSWRSSWFGSECSACSTPCLRPLRSLVIFTNTPTSDRGWKNGRYGIAGKIGEASKTMRSSWAFEVDLSLRNSFCRFRAYDLPCPCRDDESHANSKPNFIVFIVKYFMLMIVGEKNLKNFIFHQYHFAPQSTTQVGCLRCVFFFH